MHQVLASARGGLARTPGRLCRGTDATRGDARAYKERDCRTSWSCRSWVAFWSTLPKPGWDAIVDELLSEVGTIVVVELRQGYAWALPSVAADPCPLLWTRPCQSIN